VLALNHQNFIEMAQRHISLSGSSRHMVRSRWWCCVALAGTGLGRHSHSLALLGLTLGVSAYRVGAASAGFFSLIACSLSLSVSSGILHISHPDGQVSCRSPATNRYVCLFPSLPALRNLGNGGGEGWGP
jgi:hypothetical protein